MVVGLTGKYCSGKDAVARLLAQHGFALIDVDALGHEALVQHAAEVKTAFGSVVERPDGSIDRRALGQIVFADPTELARLEAIVHPPMVARVKELIAAGPKDMVINAAILHHMRLHELCGAVVVVTAPLGLRVLRGMRRDSLGLRQALARARAQRGIPRSAPVRPRSAPVNPRLASANPPQSGAAAVDTYTVPNRGSARSLERRVERLVRRLRG